MYEDIQDLKEDYIFPTSKHAPITRTNLSNPKTWHCKPYIVNFPQQMQYGAKTTNKTTLTFEIIFNYCATHPTVLHSATIGISTKTPLWKTHEVSCTLKNNGFAPF